MKTKLGGALWLSVQLLISVTLLSGCIFAGYRTPTADEPHAELRIDTKDRLRILLLNEKGCMTHSQGLAEGPSFLGMVSSRSDPSVSHLLRTDQDVILEYAAPSFGKICRITFSFRPENGERYRFVGGRFIDPKGDTFFGKEVSAEKCGLAVMKEEGAGGQQTSVPIQRLAADLASPICTRFITPEEALKKRPPAVPQF
ncbi:hypothetical protein [Variovorax sp. PAMC26660]|uniref:hypothetical protein n=1 Tax=Variovorax sp. PAMC26660 TaxID=2762322 RepID=UPI00164E2B83|nr:hypothetical protein [Variovorax sp. PAMC26660]QNK67631.1 hypothetical protein H7F35_31585 [Variovorax sp. PAMC26660]